MSLIYRCGLWGETARATVVSLPLPLLLAAGPSLACHTSPHSCSCSIFSKEFHNGRQLQMVGTTIQNLHATKNIITVDHVCTFKTIHINSISYVSVFPLQNITSSYTPDTTSSISYKCFTFLEKKREIKSV